MFRSEDSLISFDVVSLFTNIPLTETIDIVSDYVYDESNKKNRPPFKKLIFKRLLVLATGGMFAYNGKLYQQTDGVTMGSPLGPSLANFFLAHIESKLWSREENFHPRLYVRYVDDLFCVFSKDVDYRKFLDVLNSQHVNLRFTVEVGETHLAFLDTQVSIQDANFETWVFRKKTNTNVLLNFNAVCPIQWKVGLIKCL